MEGNTVRHDWLEEYPPTCKAMQQPIHVIDKTTCQFVPDRFSLYIVDTFSRTELSSTAAIFSRGSRR